MRHGKTNNHLGRKAEHRRAMLANMANSLIEHKRINTTLAKAKALRKYVEPLLTKSKADSTHNRRTVFSYLKNKEAHYERNKKNEEKIREYVISQKKPCIICSESEKACIDFHHLSNKDINVSLVHKYGSLKKAKNEIEKCVCLCANCHRKVHAGIIDLNTGVV